MSAYTTDLRFENPVPFDPAVRNTWGTILNTQRSLTDTSIVGELSLNVGGAANVILTQNNGVADQSRNAHYNLSGVLTGNINVLFPQFKRKFSVTNSTSGAFTLGIGVNNGGVPLGTTVTVPQGATMLLMSDGTDVRVRFTSVGGTLGIGMTPVNALDITQNQNAASVASILNNSAGVAATSMFRATNGTSKAELIHHGTGFTTAGILRQNGTALLGTGAGGMTVGTTANQPIYFAQNNAEVGRWTANGLRIGTTTDNASEQLRIEKNTNAENYLVSVVNSNGGNAAVAAMLLYNGTTVTHFHHFGTGFTTAGMARQDGFQILAEGTGGLSIVTGVNQPIYFGINNTEVGQWTAAGLGLGMAPANALDITKSQNAASTIKLLNGNAGAAALSSLELANGTTTGQLIHYGASFTTAGIARQDGTRLNAPGAGGLTIGTSANQPVYFIQNGAEVGRWDGTGLGIGRTAGTIFDVQKNANSFQATRATNTDGGTSSRIGHLVENGTCTGYIILHGSGWTTAGIRRQNGLIIEADGAGGLTLNTAANQPIYFGINNTQVAQFDSTNGLTLSAGVNLNIGGKTSFGAAEAIAGGADRTVTNTYARMSDNTAWTGVAGGTDGRIIVIRGPSSSTTSINHENAGSSAANRFDLPGGTNITLDDDAVATFIYNGTTSRWNLQAFSG